MTQSSHQMTIIASSAFTLELNNGREAFQFKLNEAVHYLGRDLD